MPVRTKAAARAWRAMQDGILGDLQTRFEKLKAMGSWAELDLGARIAEGMEVRRLTRTYVCIKAHEKSLARSPLNAEYWKESEL